MKIYFDCAATSKIFQDILLSMERMFKEYYANPNSIYSDGQKSRQLIEESRRNIAQYLGVEPEEIIFTSGATESNNTIIRGLAESYPEKNEIIITPIEHKSVLNPVKFLAKKGYKVHFLKIDKNGIIDIDDLKRKISEKTLLVVIIHGNNETGVLQDVETVSKICRENDVFFFSDVVQTICKEKFDTEIFDFISVSGHKINAPKGIGFFYKRKDIKLTPLLFGGGQEFGLRSGTENIAFIKFLSDAIHEWDTDNDDKVKHLRFLRDLWEINLKEAIPDIHIVSEQAKRVPHISCIIFPQVDAQSMILGLSSRDMAVSSGSACSSGTPTPSHVLTAYGYSDKEALSTLRFSFCLDNTEEQIYEGIKRVKEVFESLKEFY